MNVPLVDPYHVCKNQGATSIFHGVMSSFVHFLANSLKIFKTTRQKSFKFDLKSPQEIVHLDII